MSLLRSRRYGVASIRYRASFDSGTQCLPYSWGKVVEGPKGSHIRDSSPRPADRCKLSCFSSQLVLPAGAGIDTLLVCCRRARGTQVGLRHEWRRLWGEDVPVSAPFSSVALEYWKMLCRFLSV